MEISFFEGLFPFTVKLVRAILYFPKTNSSSWFKETVVLMGGYRGLLCMTMQRLNEGTPRAWRDRKHVHELNWGFGYAWDGLAGEM